MAELSPSWFVMLRPGRWLGIPGTWDRDTWIDAYEDFGSEDPSESSKLAEVAYFSIIRAVLRALFW